MADNELKALALKIESLEKKLDSLSQPAEPTDVSAEEIRAFQKVSSMLFDWDTACGINECQQVIIRRCGGIVRRCWVRCINECICGPCNLGGGGFRGGGFGGLGE